MIYASGYSSVSTGALTAAQRLTHALKQICPIAACLSHGCQDAIIVVGLLTAVLQMVL